MKVLQVANSNTGNPFIDLFSSAMEQYCSVVTSVDEFFALRNNYDIIHIHWPETFTNWKKPQQQDFDIITSSLSAWNQKSKIIVTRHNYEPHELESTLLKKLYHMVNLSADGIIHFGHHSKSEYFSRYDFAVEQAHEIIPHGNYNYKNNVASFEAKKMLDINSDCFVALSFGRLRNLQEKKLLIKVFESIPFENKLLLAPGWYGITHPAVLKYPFKRLYSHVVDFKFWWHPNYRIGRKFIASEEVQFYFNAADIVIIPRFQSLTSGVLILAFNFGKAVIGPEKGNIGEILRDTDNYIIKFPDIINYDWSRLKEIGRKNQKYADNKWNWNLIATQTHAFYKNISQSDAI